LWVQANKQILDSRLSQRVDKMVDAGLFDELICLKNSLEQLPWGKSDYERGIKQAIGFKAFDPYLQTLISGQDNAQMWLFIKFQF